MGRCFATPSHFGRVSCFVRHPKLKGLENWALSTPQGAVVPLCTDAASEKARGTTRGALSMPPSLERWVAPKGAPRRRELEGTAGSQHVELPGGGQTGSDPDGRRRRSVVCELRIGAFLRGDRVGARRFWRVGAWRRYTLRASATAAVADASSRSELHLSNYDSRSERQLRGKLRKRVETKCGITVVETMATDSGPNTWRSAFWSPPKVASRGIVAVLA